MNKHSRERQYEFMLLCNKPKYAVTRALLRGMARTVRTGNGQVSTRIYLCIMNTI